MNLKNFFHLKSNKESEEEIIERQVFDFIGSIKEEAVKQDKCFSQIAVLFTKYENFDFIKHLSQIKMIKKGEVYQFEDGSIIVKKSEEWLGLSKEESQNFISDLDYSLRKKLKI